MLYYYDNIIVILWKMEEKLIMETAIELFYNKWWISKVSINEIIEASWVDKKVFFHYFSDIENLYKKIVDVSFEQATVSVKLLVEGFPDIKERFVNFLVANSIYYKEHPLMHWYASSDSRFLIGDMDMDYYHKSYKKIVKVLLWDYQKEIENYNTDLESFAKFLFDFNDVIWLAESDFDFDDDWFSAFVLSYAKVVVNSFFEKKAWWEDYDDLATDFSELELRKYVKSVVMWMRK
jgi:hypothetical protein